MPISQKFIGAPGQSVRFIPMQPLITQTPNAQIVKPGNLKVELSNSSQQLFAVLKAHSFAQFLSYDAFEPLSIWAHDGRSLVILPSIMAGHDRWLIQDKENADYISCQLDTNVYCETKDLVSSLAYWSYGFNLLTPIDEKQCKSSSRFVVKHYVSKRFGKFLDISFSAALVKRKRVLVHGRIFLWFREDKAAINFDMDIVQSGMVCDHNFYKEYFLKLEDSQGVCVSIQFNRKLGFFFLTGNRLGEKISFALNIWEFEQIRLLLRTAIPTLTGFDALFA